MFRKQLAPSNGEGESESPWISFTDLMAGFLIVILLALAAAIIMLTLEKTRLREQREKFETELVDAQKARKEAETARMAAEDALRKAVAARANADAARANAIAISKEFIQLFEELRASQKDIDGTVQQMDNYDQARLELLRQMQQSLSEQEIEVEISKVGDVMHISEDNLSFKLGRYNIEERFKKNMAIIGAEVATSLKKPQASIIDTVFVEGHTDNVPNKSEMGNWGLSSYRAISLWKFWNSSRSPARNLSRLKNAENKAMFSVTGYGETRPLQVFPKGARANQRINRRIDLRFNLRTAKKDLLVELSEKVSRSVQKFDEAYEDLKDRLESLTEDDDAE